MGCGTSTAAVPSGTTIGTQTDRSFVARQKDKEAIEASSGTSNLPRRQLRPLGRGPDLNAIEADARKTLQPANVLPSIKHKDGTTQKNPVLPLYHPPLPQIPIERRAGGPSQEAAGSQGKAVVANGTETLIVIPDETFDSSDDDLSSLDDNNPDEATGYAYGNGTEKVGIASIVGARAGIEQNGAETGHQFSTESKLARNGKGGNGENRTDVSPTKMFSLGASDTVITSEELVRNSKVDKIAASADGTVSGAANDAAAVVVAKTEESQTTQDAAQLVNAPSENGPAPERSENVVNNPPEDNAPVQENNNNPSPKGPVELLLQNGNGDTLKKIHVGDNFSVAVNIVLQAVDPASVLQNNQAGVGVMNPQADQNGGVVENSVSLVGNAVKVANKDQPGATTNASEEENIPVAGKNLLELTDKAECTETSVVSDSITSSTTDDNVNMNGNNAKGLPEVIVTDHEEDSEKETQENITDHALDDTTTGKQRRMLQLLRDFDLKKMLEERRRKRAKEHRSNAEEPSSNGNAKEQNLSNETIERKIPEPNAPQRKKAAVLGKEETSLFKHIEVHAVYHALEPPKAADTFATHVKSLLVDDLSDLERVRMLFHWVTAQNLQDMTFGDDVVEESPLGYLKVIKEGKGTCAKLFEQLCSAASLKCHVIKGYKKSDDCLPDHSFHDQRKQHRGTWNAVLVDGEWRLVDCHWAARGVRAIEENGGAIENVNDVYKYEEFYFLTDPEDLIDTHFPDCPEWQLVEKYLTITQFQSRVKRWPMFHRFGLELKSHRAVVVIPAGDFVELTLGFSKEKRKEFRIVYELTTKEGGSEVGGISLNRYVVQETWDCNENFTIDVPKSGTYVLDIYGKPHAEVSGNEGAKVCQYMIVCDTLKDNGVPFPEYTGTWGPGKVLATSGIFPVSHARAVVRSQGQVELTFQTNRHLEFRHRLYTQQFDENGLENFVVHSVTKHRISFHVRTPTKGKYGLIIFAKDPKDGTLKLVYSYVIICENEPNGITLFPVVRDGQFGTRQPYFSEFGLIENENASYFLTSDNGEVEVQLENPNQKQIMYSLSLRTEHGVQKFDRYALAQALGDKTVLLLHLPQEGEYALQLFAKHSQGQQRNVVNYCISCSAAKEDCKPFPCQNDSIWGPVYPTFSDFGLALDVPPRPCLISRSGKYNVSLAMTQPLLLRHHFFHCAEETRENMDDFAFCETIKHKATVTTCCPKAGDYCLEIYGTTFPPRHDDLPLVATFLLRCLHPLETGCKTFPQIIGRMWGPGCCLYEPLAGILSRDREVTFRVDVPDADDVVLKSPDSVTNMTKDQSETWTCSYVPRESDTSILLLGKFDKNVNKYVGLLEFKFGN
ncbi:KY [Branchiostoma lanceolatum]|uniref:KY protein n=1 Tax=Branchiostoma lanceolatum TaxID=7740 RepID=A0A8J9ZN96_BRALA|nr:KY [Branchiostoma lanceolatum]